MKRGDLVQLVPLSRLSVLLAILPWFFYRKQDHIKLRIVFGGIFAVAGAFLIVSGN